jgi:hypothetical protein
MRATAAMRHSCNAKTDDFVFLGAVYKCDFANERIAVRFRVRFGAKSI